jgi:glycosyltransferase involved in cell wall biosynthesis
MGLESFVEFMGRVSDRDLCRYLSTADVCLDPDPYTEWSNQSTMNKIMEYMAFGKPTVAFDLKENHYSAGEAAVYARPNRVEEFAKLIIELLNDQPRRQKMGELGLKRVQTRLAWDYSKPYLWAAYKKAIATE